MPRSDIDGLLELMRGAPPASSIAELRATFAAAIPLFNVDPPEVGRIETAVPVGDSVRADLLVPPGTPPFPTLIYLHGGGWSIGGPATHAKLTRQLCIGARVAVVSVDYRLSPEHPFPAALDDCVTAARWVRSHAAEFGADATRIAIGGDSAGGNLSAAVVNELRTELGFRGVLLFYGAFDVLGCRRDYDRWAPVEDPVIPKSAVDLMIGAYLGGGVSNDDPRVSPIRADLTHFPPACLVCGTWDPLLGDSRALRDKLVALGRTVTLHEYAEMPHAFVQMPVPEAGEAIAVSCAFLSEVLR